MNDNEKHLDLTGLAYFWAKIKEKLNLKADKTDVPTKTSQLTNDSGFVTVEEAESTYAKKADVSSVYRYKGSKAAVDDLPSADNTVGDVWNVEATNMNYGWTGTDWDPLGQSFSVVGITSSEIDTIMAS